MRMNVARFISAVTLRPPLIIGPSSRPQGRTERRLLLSHPRVTRRFLQEHEISPVDDWQEANTDNDRRDIDVKGVDKVEHTPPEAEVPKISRHEQFLLLLGNQPLQKKTRTKHEVPGKAEDRPPITSGIKPRNPLLQPGFQKLSRNCAHLFL